MQVREYAERVVCSEVLQDKLTPPPEGLLDTQPKLVGALPLRPGRPDNIRITKGVRVPSPEGMHDPAQRRRILHAFANHELQAVELFAWALLAFPDQAPAFRRGLLGILQDEQRHFGLYIDRLNDLGAAFADEAVSGYFWNKTDHLADPIRFVCAMGLTFESANLDHALDYQRIAMRAKDLKTAEVLQTIHDDEVRHVGFSWRWLRTFTAGEDPWKAYSEHLDPPLRPAKARGRHFSRESRLLAGLDPDFIQRVADAQ